MLVLDMIEILSAMGKYKYENWRILSVKCYIGNSMRLRSCIQNINKHFWRHCRGGRQYILSIYRLHRIILTSIISLTDLSAVLWLFVVVTGMFCRTRVTDSSPLIPEVYVEIYLNRTSGISHPTS
jgi:hypothetical protein